MNKTILCRLAKFFIVPAMAMGFATCADEKQVAEVQTAGIDKVSRISVYPNSPVLTADGEATLDFLVECYYKIDDSDDEYPLPEDRVPLDEIIITASDGTIFTPEEGYATNDTSMASVSFVATLGEMESTPSSVEIRLPVTYKYDVVTVPVRFVALYDNATESVLDNLTESVIRESLDRLNKVFADSLAKAPSSIDSGIRFEFEGFVEQEYEEAPWSGLPDEVTDYQMSDWNDVVYVWIYSSLSTSSASDFCPHYVEEGSAGQLPGLDVSDYTDETQLEPEDVGIAVSYRSFFGSGEPIETAFGRYYGLLETGNYDPSALVDGDLDYCDDTYSYLADYLYQKKETLVPEGESSISYLSYNIMDSNSSCTTITTEQAARIRKVMEIVPQRRQGIK